MGLWDLRLQDGDGVPTEGQNGQGCLLEPLCLSLSAHIVSVTLALNNTLFLIKETEYMPWQAALSSLSYFKLMFDRSEVYGPLQVQWAWLAGHETDSPHA